MNDIQNDSKGEIVMYQPDETIRLEVKLEDDTVWLTQQQMSLLFSVKENTITYHIKEIYRTEELEKEGTARKIRVVRKEGNRSVNRTIDFYNLDMIISVGYKVNSKRGVKFRQWASKVLKDYLIKGYSINKGLQEIRECIDSHDRFLIIDDTVYLFGASLKDAGKKLFAYIKMQETSAADLLHRIR